MAGLNDCLIRWLSANAHLATGHLLIHNFVCTLWRSFDRWNDSNSGFCRCNWTVCECTNSHNWSMLMQMHSHLDATLDELVIYCRCRVMCCLVNSFDSDLGDCTNFKCNGDVLKFVIFWKTVSATPVYLQRHTGGRLLWYQNWWNNNVVILLKTSEVTAWSFSSLAPTIYLE